MQSLLEATNGTLLKITSIRNTTRQHLSWDEEVYFLDYEQSLSERYREIKRSMSRGGNLEESAQHLQRECQGLYNDIMKAMESNKQAAMNAQPAVKDTPSTSSSRDTTPRASANKQQTPKAAPTKKAASRKSRWNQYFMDYGVTPDAWNWGGSSMAGITIHNGGYQNTGSVITTIPYYVVRDAMDEIDEEA